MDGLEQFLNRINNRIKKIASHTTGAVPDYLAGQAPYAKVDTVKSQDGKRVTTRITGILGSMFGADPRAIIAEWDKTKPEAITLLIDSPGGLVSAGLALYADLMARVKDQGVEVRTEARGIVASAAVLPFLAGDVRVMREGSVALVHSPWSVMLAVGDENDMEKEYQSVSAGLRAAKERMGTITVLRTGQPADVVKGWLSKDTWFQPQGALDAGLASKIDEAVADGELSSLTEETLLRLQMQTGGIL